MVGISIDGTKLWQRSFENFVNAVGELGSRLPLGSCVLLQGSETTQILRDRVHQENLNPGIRCSRARCGTSPILGVVNTAGTPTFTCYIGAI